MSRDGPGGVREIRGGGVRAEGGREMGASIDAAMSWYAMGMDCTKAGLLLCSVGSSWLRRDCESMTLAVIGRWPASLRRGGRPTRPTWCRAWASLLTTVDE